MAGNVSTASAPLWPSIPWHRRRFRVDRLFGKRIIPAHAGSTPRFRQGLLVRRIIPAPAGSTFDALALSISGRGSSPRLRGALRCPMRSAQRCRIIPAPAGSTLADLG